jgi:putative Ca2+/H+ antiporter (TMEM165/GDT1 family)
MRISILVSILALVVCQEESQLFEEVEGLVDVVPVPVEVPISAAETEDHLPAFFSSFTSIFVSEIGDKVLIHTYISNLIIYRHSS